MLTEDILQPLLQKMFKIVSHSMDTSLDILSSFINCLIDSCLLYARLDCTQQTVDLSKVSKVIQSGLCLSFCCNFFTNLLASNLQTLTDPFP